MTAIGLVMLAAVAVTMIATGLPGWIVLLGIAMSFAGGGVALDVVPASLLTAIPARLTGLLESDLLQALPLYALLGALLNHLPLADALFRTASRLFARTGAGPSLAGLALGLLLAPMSGSVGASVAMQTRAVQPRLAEGGVSVPQGAALVCIASTLGVLVPPSLVLILLGDAMMRAHTEALNVTGAAVRIINTQDLFMGALVPAALLVTLCGAVAWWRGRGAALPAAKLARREWIVSTATAAFIGGLLVTVTLGYLYAVEAAAAGGVALLAYGLATRMLTRPVLREVLRDTMALTGALFALLVAATVFTLVFRAFGTDRWIAAALAGLPGGRHAALAAVLLGVALCALVLDAFEMIFVVIPAVMPPLLMLVPEVTWVAVLTLLVLQASFLMPPFGYAVLMVRNATVAPLRVRELASALAPYLAVQLVTLLLVAVWPALVWQRNPLTLAPAGGERPLSHEEQLRLLERQLELSLPPLEPSQTPARP